MNGWMDGCISLLSSVIIEFKQQLQSVIKIKMLQGKYVISDRKF